MEYLKLKDYVSHFSAQLKFDSKHEEEVTVGGKIVSIIPPVANTDEGLHMVILDDSLGENYVYVPFNLIHTHPDVFKIGISIVVKGFVSILTRKIKGEEKKDVSIFAYQVKDISVQVKQP